MHRAFSGANQIAVADEKKQLTADSKNQPRSVLIDCVARQVYPVVPFQYTQVRLSSSLSFLYTPPRFFPSRHSPGVYSYRHADHKKLLRRSNARTDFILGIIQASSAKTCRKINCQRTEKYN